MELAMYEGDQLHLTAMMGTYPKTEPLKRKAVTSGRFALEFAPVDVAQKGFKAVVREARYDIAEIAIVTFLQAFAAGKPYRLLPLVLNGGGPPQKNLSPGGEPPPPPTPSRPRPPLSAPTPTPPTPRT